MRSTFPDVFDALLAAGSWDLDLRPKIRGGDPRQDDDELVFLAARRPLIEWALRRAVLLVGATINQHPDLYGAAVAESGVMDMLRFHRFTIGWAWTGETGSADDPEQFRTLLAYSPLHNIRPGVAYPPTLVTTGDHDDRVVPGHSFKFAAALQAAQAGEAPIIIRIDTDAGHGLGTPVSKLIDERADVLAFLELALGSR
jgi:prolyl oligopeptidase